MVGAVDWSVGGDFHDAQVVDAGELCGLRGRSTSHARQLLEAPEETLQECWLTPISASYILLFKG